jgi:methylase of polypeptide subunit release factors
MMSGYSGKENALLELLFFLKGVGYYFVTPTPTTHLRVNERIYNKRARTLAGVFGWNRPFDQSLLPDTIFRILANENIIAETPNGWKSTVRASTIGTEIFLHSSFPTSSSDAVFFGPDTYRFVRSIRTYLAMNLEPIGRSLDIGCGTGAGGIIIGKSCPSCREVVMTDVNEAALRLCRVNSQFSGATNCVSLYSSLFDRVDGEFDLIVSNPPYLNDPLLRRYRHGGGALGSELSLKIAEESLSRLRPSGTLLLYTGSPIVNGKDAFHGAVAEILAQSKMTWSYEELDPDVFGEELNTDRYANVDRIAAVVLIARK